MGKLQCCTLSSTPAQHVDKRLPMGRLRHWAVLTWNGNDWLWLKSLGGRLTYQRWRCGANNFHIVAASGDKTINTITHNINYQKQSHWIWQCAHNYHTTYPYPVSARLAEQNELSYSPSCFPQLKWRHLSWVEIMIHLWQHSAWLSSRHSWIKRLDSISISPVDNFPVPLIPIEQWLQL